jgi:hypothetical protein
MNEFGCAMNHCGVAGGDMSEFAQTLKDLAKLCGKSEYQLAQYTGLDPSFVRRMVDGEKRASDLTIIRLTIWIGDGPGAGQAASRAGSVHSEQPEERAAQRCDCDVRRVSGPDPLAALG